MKYIRPFLVFVITLSVFWLGGVDFTTRNPPLAMVVALAIFFSLMLWPDRTNQPPMQMERDVLDTSRGHDR